MGLQYFTEENLNSQSKMPWMSLFDGDTAFGRRMGWRLTGFIQNKLEAITQLTETNQKLLPFSSNLLWTVFRSTKWRMVGLPCGQFQGDFRPVKCSSIWKTQKHQRKWVRNFVFLEHKRNVTRSETRRVYWSKLLEIRNNVSQTKLIKGNFNNPLARSPATRYNAQFNKGRHEEHN